LLRRWKAARVLGGPELQVLVTAIHRCSTTDSTRPRKLATGDIAFPPVKRIIRSGGNTNIMLRIFRPGTSIVAVLLLLAGASCASNSPQEAGYNAFLNRIATDCTPLIIGSDNIGQAIVFNGLGAKPDNYTNFLGQTSALYSGSIPPEVYRNSLTNFLGGGTSNGRSFDCIVAHLPKIN
jgi:hypothetical protein